MAHFYILFSNKLNKYYVGSTSHLDSRLLNHNSGNSKFTKAGIPWVLVYSEYFENYTDYTFNIVSRKVGKLFSCCIGIIHCSPDTSGTIDLILLLEKEKYIHHFEFSAQIQ